MTSLPFPRRRVWCILRTGGKNTHVLFVPSAGRVLHHTSEKWRHVMRSITKHIKGGVTSFMWMLGFNSWSSIYWTSTVTSLFEISNHNRVGTEGSLCLSHFKRLIIRPQTQVLTMKTFNKLKIHTSEWQDGFSPPFKIAYYKEILIPARFLIPSIAIICNTEISKH